MFINSDYEDILARVLGRIDDNLDKREGSVLYNAVAPVCAELAQAYVALENIFDFTFADTAPRQYLIRRAAERGLKPKEANKAVAEASFNVAIPLGTRFSSADYNWVVIKDLGSNKYEIECETPGSIRSGQEGILIPIEYIKGLERASLIRIISKGQDEEETEVFRKRYFESFKSSAFSGNRADYIQKINEVEGVGSCKVLRATNAKAKEETGHVLAIITNQDYQEADSRLIEKVQNALDPKKDNNGDGLAPIGHILNVKSAKAVIVDISCSFSFENGYNFKNLQSTIEKTVDDYLKEVNKTWHENNQTVVRISALESRFLSIDGILDVNNTKINKQANNLTLLSEEIAKRGIILNG